MHNLHNHVKWSIKLTCWNIHNANAAIPSIIANIEDATIVCKKLKYLRCREPHPNGSDHRSALSLSYRSGPDSA